MIKKYPNRRLYDTTESRYITRADVQKMVIDRVDFVVVDKTSREDITRSILLQIISQQEEGHDPMMSRDFLSRVIRTHDHATNSITASYLEQSLKLLTSHIDARAGSTAADVWDSAAAGGLAEQNFQRWRSVQDAVQEKISQTLDEAHEAAQDAAHEAAQEAAPLPPPPLAGSNPLPVEATG
jgi:polyhydroxyalkanoate synthesis repressor PhaR